MPSLEASSATTIWAPGNAPASASSVAPIRSASLCAATITTGSPVGSADKAGYSRRRHAGHEHNVEAHITGTVWKVEVAVGDQVDEGDTVVILESMKMEMPVEAEDPGTVTEIRCEEGQSVQEGDVLVVLG